MSGWTETNTEKQMKEIKLYQELKSKVVAGTNLWNETNIPYNAIVVERARLLEQLRWHGNNWPDFQWEYDLTPFRVQGEAEALLRVSDGYHVGPCVLRHLANAVRRALVHVFPDRVLVDIVHDLHIHRAGAVRVQDFHERPLGNDDFLLLALCLQKAARQAAGLFWLTNDLRSLKGQFTASRCNAK